ncbi:FAD-dependent oxidoreductase [candidate division KSB1 bacterium]
MGKNGPDPKYSVKSLPLPISTSSTDWHPTGGWRHLRPVMNPKAAPCRHGCPAGIDIRAMTDFISRGDYFHAWKTVLADSPFPGTCGRVCYYPCESNCSRAAYDDPVAIHQLERFGFDRGYRAGYIDPVINKKLGSKPQKVAVVGSGPAGMSCAYHLARQGYNVTVFERESEPGGILRYGIPAYRLPPEIIDKEINVITSLGVKIETGRELLADLDLKSLGRFDASFLAIGAHSPHRIGLETPPGDNGLLLGLDFLNSVAHGLKKLPGRRVAVVGGGNTAVDAARTVRRLGGEAVIVYRRTETEMPAHPREVKAAKAEDIHMVFLAAPIDLKLENGKIAGLNCQKMKLGRPEADGRRRPQPVRGSTMTVDVDSVIIATGEVPDIDGLPGRLISERGFLKVDTGFMTPSRGLFAGGDAVSGAGTVVDAIAHGKEAARRIDLFLGGEGEIGTELIGRADVRPHPAYFTRKGETRTKELNPGEAAAGFDEVVSGYDPASAAIEADRCFMCGTCNGCGVCFVFCPDAAILPDGNEFKINYDYCKGCGVCAEECPRAVIDLEEESRWRI